MERAVSGIIREDIGWSCEGHVEASSAPEIDMGALLEECVVLAVYMEPANVQERNGWIGACMLSSFLILPG